MTFRSRSDAGQQLAQFLTDANVSPDVIVGLPRGGVMVAVELAGALHRPVDVLVVRKLGHPRFREFAVGALAEGGVVLLHEEALRDSRVVRAELDAVVAEETARLKAYQALFESGKRTSLSGRSVLLVDDGLATGATMEVAVMSARKQGAARVEVAVPVSSTTGYARLVKVADAVHTLWIDPQFEAVGQYYARFPQVSDEEVRRALAVGRVS